MSGGTRSYELARRLVEDGHIVEMITTHRDSESNKTGWHVTNECGINVHWYNLPYTNNMGYLSRILVFFKFAFASIFKAISIKADLVFATSTPLTIAIPAIIKSKISRIPMVFEVRDLWPDIPIAIGALKNPAVKFIARSLEKIAYKNSESIVALSDGMKDGIVNSGYPTERVCVLPNACDNATFSTLQNTYQDQSLLKQHFPNSPILLYAGTIGKINGIDYLVKLSKDLIEIDPTIKVVVVGEGKEKEKIKLLAETEKVMGNNFFIFDQVTKNEIPQLLHDATIVCSMVINLPELRANSANKFFDALSTGKPIFINYGGWQKDLLEKNGSGFSTLGLDINEAAILVSQKIHDSHWLKTASKSSRELSITKFDRDQLYQKFQLVLTDAHQRNGYKCSKNSY